MKKILLGLVVCAAFCACSNDDVVLTSTTTPEIGGDGYISLAINLPTTGSTRANDVYDDGLASEYAVNDATLLLFGGTSESTATFYASYNLNTSFNQYESTTDNITSRSQLTQQIDTPANGDIYAMVVLNNNGLLTTTGTNPTLVSGTTTLSSLQSTIQTLGGVSAMTTTGFFMCNAPLTTTLGGSSVPAGSGVTTLAKIDSDQIFTSAAEAQSHPATEIYVERGMAKVTVVDSAPTTVGDTDIPVAIDGFILDLTNNVSYLVRNTTGAEEWWGYANGYTGLATNYRMAGNVEVGSGLYRTYWAVDPNYNDVPYTGEEGNRNYGTTMTSLQGTSPTLGNVGADYPQYCLENTFNVAHMNQDETTRAIIGATLYNGADFFIWDNDKTTAYLDDDDLTAEGATTGLEKIKALIMTQMQAEGYMEEAEAAWVGPYDETTQSYNANMYDYITIVFDEEENLVASDNLTFTYTVSSDVVADWFVNPDDRTQPLGYIPAALVVSSTAYYEVVEDLNTHHQVAYYEGGESYYPVMIQHFGDDLTYWDESIAGTTGTANQQSYPENVWGNTSEQNWLGRYGVLRNNWYEINVTGVNTIGSATVPTAYGDPDDPTQKWISIEINILSWAKRTQDVTL